MARTKLQAPACSCRRCALRSTCDSKPTGAGRKVLWTDRGKSFYAPSTGRITQQYEQALREHGFSASFASNASVQPGKLQELMLHETAVAWMRVRLAQSVPPKAWKEPRVAYTARLKRCCADVNHRLNVEGLCRDLLLRGAECVQAKGGRIRQ